MNKADFDFMTGIIKDSSGLVLGDDKLYLLESRLTPVAHKFKLDSLDALIKSLRTAPRGPLLAEVVDAMGFDTIDAGALAEGVRFEPGTSAFGATASRVALLTMLEAGDSPAVARGRMSR